MDEDKIDKTLEILLQNQAQFYANLQEIQQTQQEIQQTQKEIQQIQKESEKRPGVLERVSLNLYNTTVEQGKNIGQLTEDIKELRAAQKETDDRLKAVIFMAEKFFGSQNGDSGKK